MFLSHSSVGCDNFLHVVGNSSIALNSSYTIIHMHQYQIMQINIYEFSSSTFTTIPSSGQCFVEFQEPPPMLANKWQMGETITKYLVAEVQMYYLQANGKWVKQLQSTLLRKCKCITYSLPCPAEVQMYYLQASMPGGNASVLLIAFHARAEIPL